MMSENGNGRKSRIRAYAEVNHLPYTAALRKFEQAEKLFPEFHRHWVKFVDNPIRLEWLDLMLSLTPTVEVRLDIDWDDLTVDDMRGTAFNVAMDDIPYSIEEANAPAYDWSANGASLPDDDDEEARKYRVHERINQAMSRLYGVRLQISGYENGHTLWEDTDSEDSAVTANLELADIERRGAYDEVAATIKKGFEAARVGDGEGS
jgi:hypothetical protein